MARTTPVTDRCAWDGMEHRDLTQTPPWEEASEPGAQQPPDHTQATVATSRLPPESGGPGSNRRHGQEPADRST